MLWDRTDRCETIEVESVACPAHSGSYRVLRNYNGTHSRFLQTSMVSEHSLFTMQFFPNRNGFVVRTRTSWSMTSD